MKWIYIDPDIKIITLVFVSISVVFNKEILAQVKEQVSRCKLGVRVVGLYDQEGRSKHLSVGQSVRDRTRRVSSQQTAKGFSW